MRSRPLGEQTVTVIEQVPRSGARSSELVDGTRTNWPGCSVQPAGDPTETTDRGVTTTSRWRLFAPAGFRARAIDEVEVVPGPETDDGGPARLRIVGQVERPPARSGATHHVVAVLTRTTGRGR